MKSAANTFIRIIAWACVVFGVLFTVLKAWLIGVPTLGAGALLLFFVEKRNRPHIAGNLGMSSNEDQAMFPDFDEHDARSPAFGLTEDLREHSS